MDADQMPRKGDYMRSIKKSTISVLAVLVLLVSVLYIAGINTAYAATVEEVEPNENKNDASVINVGDWFSGEIGSYELHMQRGKSDSDYIKVNCREGQTYTVKMKGLEQYYASYIPEKYRTLVVLLDFPDGKNKLLRVGDYAEFEYGYDGYYYTFVAPESGDYYLWLSNYTDSLTKKEHYYTIGIFSECDMNGSHKYGNWVVTKEASCTEDGEREKVCSVCEEKITETIEKGHKWNKSYTVDLEPTCTEEGSESIHCSRCDEIKEGSSRVVPQKHSYGAWETIKKSTELAAGLKTHTCTECGKEETVAIKQLKPSLPAVAILAPTPSKKSATIKWKTISKANQKKIASLQIQYSMDRNFKKGVKTITANKTAVSKKITKLASKKKYYVRIRTYKKDKNGAHISKWSAVKSVTVK